MSAHYQAHPAFHKVSEGIIPPVAHVSNSLPLAADRARRREKIALIIILALALCVRLANLGAIPSVVNPDEADNAQDALHILDGMPRPGGFFGFDWKPQPAFSVYMLSWFFQAFGASVFSLRLPSALISVVALIPFYALARRQCSSLAALIATSLLAVDTWYLGFSRSGWENVHIACFGLLTMIALLAAIDALDEPNHPRRAWYLFAAAGVACALGMYGYFSGRAIPLALLAFAPAALIMRRARSRQIALGYALLFGTAIVLFLPMLATIIANWELFNGRVRVVSFFASPEYQADPTGALGAHVWQNISALWDGRWVNIVRYTPIGRPLVDQPTFVLLVIGMVTSLRSARRLDAFLWWSMLLVPWFITQVLTTSTPDAARGVGWMPVLFLFAATGLDEIFRLGTRLRRPLPQIVPIAACIGAVLLGIYDLATYMRWQTDPDTREHLRPYVPVEQFDAWKDEVIARARAGGGSLSVGEWADKHANKAPLDASAPTNPSSAAPSTIFPLSNPAQWPPKLATLGGPTSGLGRLSQPQAVAVAPDGSIYVVDAAPDIQQIKKYAPDGAFVLSWGGPASNRQDSRFVEAWGVAVSPAGEVFVLDSSAGDVQVFDANGAFLRRVAAPKISFYSPRALAVDAQGTIYIADTGQQRVVAIGRDGALLRTYGDATVPQAERLAEPSGITIGPDGSMYAADAPQHLVRHYGRDGALLHTWSIASTSARDGPRLLSGGDGTIYVTQPEQCAVLHFTADGALLDSFGDCEHSEYLKRPSGLAISATGKLYVSDASQSVVHVYNTSQKPAGP